MYIIQYYGCSILGYSKSEEEAKEYIRFANRYKKSQLSYKKIDELQYEEIGIRI